MYILVIKFNKKTKPVLETFNSWLKETGASFSLNLYVYEGSAEPEFFNF
jgi:hypothetical protein